MKKWRNKILSAVLVLSLLLTSSSFAFAEGDDTDYGTRIEPTAISLEGSSRKGDGDANNAFDGNTSTYWESAWDPVVDDSRFITLDLGSWTYLSHLTFIPRQKDTQFNGIPKYLYIYVSDVTTDFSGTSYSDENYEWKLAKIVDWTDLKSLIDNWGSLGQEDKNKVQSAKEIEFNNDISTRYVKLYAPETYHHGGETLFITDLTFYKNTDIANSNVPTITTQPQSNAYLNKNAIASLNVAVTESNITYQWYKTEDGTLDSGVVIPNAIASTYQPTDFGNYFVKVTSADGSYVFSNIAEIKSFEAKVNDNYYVSFKDAVSQALNGSTIEVLKDIEITENIPITDKEITIKSSGEEKYTIIRAESFTNSDMFYVNTNAGKLTLDNIIIDGGAKWTGDKDPVLDRGTTNNGVSTGTTIISIANSAEFNLNAGATLQNGAITSNGGAIYIETGTANVYGKIINNHAGLTGGAIRIQSSGTANIYDGALISGNSAEGEGGVLYSNNVNAVINIHGGNFINNKANDGSVVYNKGTTNIDGAKISGNTATRNGTIYINSGTVNLNGGTITGNTATNGGAVYVNNGTLNLGEANNDYALTISGNTATNGDSIYYGGTGTININAKLKLDGEIYLHTNGMKINQKCDLSGSAPITLVGNRSIEGFITVSNDSYKSSALNVFRVKDGSPAILKPTVISGSDLNVVRNSSMSISNDLGDNLTYYRGIENNLFTVTGSGSITYIWYEKAPDSNEFTKVGEDLNSLSDGTHTVYCVATDGTNYMVSDVAEVTVADFVPCSKAIDKFKNI